MQQMKRWWHFVLQEPFIWLFYYLFQPKRFRRDIEAEGLIPRFIVMLRLVLPMFLCSFPITLIARLALNFIYPTFYLHPLATGILYFLHVSIWSTTLGVIAGLACVFIIGTAPNIAFSFTVSMVAGIL